MRALTLLALAAVLSCAGPNDSSVAGDHGPIELFDGRIIPAMPEMLGLQAQYELRVRWLTEKHQMLPELMRRHEIDMWIVVSEEFHPDPVAQYVAPPLHSTPSRYVMVFVDAGPDGLASYSDYWRLTGNYGRFFDPLPAARNERDIQNSGQLRRTIRILREMAMYIHLNLKKKFLTQFREKKHKKRS